MEQAASNKQHQLQKTDIWRDLSVAIEISSGHLVLSMKHYLHINLLLTVYVQMHVCVCLSEEYACTHAHVGMAWGHILAQIIG